MAWLLDPITRALSDQARGIPYNGGGPWDPANCAESLKPHAAELSRIIRASFPWVHTIGGLRCSRNTHNGDQLSIHAVGRALDVMVPVLGGVEGEQLANWLIANAEALGIQLVIWNRSVWQPSLPARSRFSGYTGPSPHTDHVHVEVTDVPGPALRDRSIVLTAPRSLSRGGGAADIAKAVFLFLLLRQVFRARR